MARRAEGWRGQIDTLGVRTGTPGKLHTRLVQDSKSAERLGGPLAFLPLADGGAPPAPRALSFLRIRASRTRVTPILVHRAARARRWHRVRQESREAQNHSKIAGRRLLAFPLSLLNPGAKKPKRSVTQIKETCAWRQQQSRIVRTTVNKV